MTIPATHHTATAQNVVAAVYFTPFNTPLSNIPATRIFAGGFVKTCNHLFLLSTSKMAPKTMSKKSASAKPGTPKKGDKQSAKKRQPQGDRVWIESIVSVLSRTCYGHTFQIFC